MNPFNVTGTMTVLVLGAFVIVGCSSSKTTTKESEQSSQVTPQPVMPNAGTQPAEGGASVEVMTPASTVQGIWAQIEGERARLSSTIQNGQLQDVHHLAFGIRDLVVALANKANAESPAGATRLNGMVDLVKESAIKLDQFGDGGDVSGTQAEFAKLEAVLSAIKSAVGIA